MRRGLPARLASFSLQLPSGKRPRADISGIVLGYATWQVVVGSGLGGLRTPPRGPSSLKTTVPKLTKSPGQGPPGEASRGFAPQKGVYGKNLAPKMTPTWSQTFTKKCSKTCSHPPPPSPSLPLPLCPRTCSNRSEGFPRTGYFVPRPCVRWVGEGGKF